MAKKDENKNQKQEVDRKKTPAGQRTGVRVEKGPEHTRAPGQGHRSTAMTFEEIRQVNHELAQAEDYKDTEQRATKFGPNRSESLNKVKKDENPLEAQVRLSYEQALGTGPNKEVEKELAEAGYTLEPKPERYDPSKQKYEGAGQAPDPVEAATQKADKNALGNPHLDGDFETQRGLHG